MAGEFEYVDEHRRRLVGKAAQQALAATTDADAVGERGVVRVSRSRWQEAQRYERAVWMEDNRHVASDRNEDHESEFQGYSALKGLSFRHALEIGCGPFTNLRLIADVCRIAECSLIDPLINVYLGHRYCAYDRTALLVRRRLWHLLADSRIRRSVRWILARLLPFCVYREVPVREILASPVEEMPTGGRAYDLVVLINVLEHCYDLDAVLSRLLAVSSAEAYLVFHDKMYNPADIQKVAERRVYDAGHCLRPHRRELEAFLARNYQELLRRTTTKRNPGCVSFPFYDGIYYIGRRTTR